MAVYLVQHGIALSKDVDPECPLSEEGIQEVKLIAGVAANYKIFVDTIYHSGKKRARQTAELFAEQLHPVHGCVDRSGLKPLDDVAEIGGDLSENSNVMLVGHLPFMEKLVSYLIVGNIDFRPFKFQNGGIVCLDRDEGDQRWYVKWALMPNIG